MVEGNVIRMPVNQHNHLDLLSGIDQARAGSRGRRGVDELLDGALGHGRIHVAVEGIRRDIHRDDVLAGNQRRQLLRVLPRREEMRVQRLLGHHHAQGTRHRIVLVRDITELAVEKCVVIAAADQYTGALFDVWAVSSGALVVGTPDAGTG